MNLARSASPLAMVMAKAAMTMVLFFSTRSAHATDPDSYPNDDANYFKLSLNYTYDPKTPNSSYFRTLLLMRDLFFLGSDDIAVELEFHSPFETALSVSKWGFFQYHLALGVEAGYLLNNNVFAESVNQNTLYIKDFLGNRFGFVAFARYTFSANVSVKLGYGLEFNRYRTSSETPVGFVLPEDNIGQSLLPSFTLRKDTLNGISWLGLGNGGHVWRSEARQFGIAGEREQLKRATFGSVRGFLDYRGQWLFGLAGLSALAGSPGGVRLGMPLAQRDRYDDILYGFPDQAIDPAVGLLQRAMLRARLLSGYFSPEVHYAVLVDKENNSAGAHVHYGWGAGLEAPLAIPYIGLYFLSITYQQAFRDVQSSYNPLEPWNFQVLGTVQAQQTW
jgi:hypothetical protein